MTTPITTYMYVHVQERCVQKIDWLCVTTCSRFGIVQCVSLAFFSVSDESDDDDMDVCQGEMEEVPYPLYSKKILYTYIAGPCCLVMSWYACFWRLTMSSVIVCDVKIWLWSIATQYVCTCTCTHYCTCTCTFQGTCHKSPTSGLTVHWPAATTSMDLKHTIRTVIPRYECNVTPIFSVYFSL